MSRISDFYRELKIKFWLHAMNSARTNKERLVCWERMKELINGRSKEQVRRMETRYEL